MEGTTAPITTLHPNPWNPNKMDERTFEAEIESIRRFGFIDPITVRPHPEIEGEYQIIDGEHRMRAAIDAGLEEVPLTVLHDLPDEDAKRLTVILNETRGRADTLELGSLLRDLADGMSLDDLLVGLPYTGEELRELVSVGDFDWDAGAPSGGEDDEIDDDGEFVRLAVTMPHDAYEIFMHAVEKMKTALERDKRYLHKNKPLAFGQVIEYLSAEYLSGPDEEA